MKPALNLLLKPRPSLTNWPGLALCIALLPFPTLFLGWLDGKLIESCLWAVAEYGIAAGILVWYYWGEYDERKLLPKV